MRAGANNGGWDKPLRPRFATWVISRAANTIGQWADRAPLRFAFVATLVLISLPIIVIRPSYETCDDIFMTMIASGKGLSHTPDEHLVFTNALIGKALKQLYSTWPAFPWYGSYLLLVHFLAQTAMLYGALSMGRQRLVSRDRTGRFDDSASAVRLSLCLYLLYFCLAELPLLNRFQFTTTAFVAAQAGIMLMFVAWHRRVLQCAASVSRLLAAAVTLLLIGGLVRLESLAMATLVATPIALLFAKDFSLVAFRPCGLAIASLAALLAGAVVIDEGAYENDPAWSGYRSLNQLRGKFHDGSWTFYSAQTAPLFSRVGWTENDHAMIARWYSDDSELYSSAKLSSILDAYPWRSSRNYSGLAKHAFRDISRNRYVLAIILALPFVLVFVHRERTPRHAVLASLVAAIALIVCIVWLKKVPPQRVFLPLLSFPLSAALMALAWRIPPGGSQTSADDLFDADGWQWTWSAWRRLPLARQVAATLLVVAIVMSAFRQIRQASLVQRDRIAFRSFLDSVRLEDKKLYVSWEAALPYELHSPFDALEAWSQVPLLSLAWPQCTPCHEETKRLVGINNLGRALYERNDVVLIATPLHRKLFAMFVKEHFGDEVEFVPNPQVTAKFVAGSLRRKAAVAEAAGRQEGVSQR